MTRNILTPALGTLLLGALPTQAQDIKVNAIVDLWYTQALDSNLRQNSTANGQTAYYQLNGAFKENGVSVRRTEIYLNGKATDDISFSVLFDPNTSIAASSPSTLLDAFIVYKVTPEFSIKAGQFKPLQTYEASLVPATEVLFYDRSQLARQFGDKRDRGIVATYAWGDTAALAGKVNVGVFNGTSDKDGGKANDANAQKDFVTRFEFTYGKEQKFGLYTRNGSTDAAENKGPIGVNGFAYADAASAPDATQIRDAKDETTNLGVYYAFENARWIAQGEAITGLLGRRFPSVGIAKPDATVAVPTPVTPAAQRQYIDQKYLGYVLTGGYKLGQHTFLVRYDFLNYNKGNDYYGAYNPYTQHTANKFDKTTQSWIPDTAAGSALKADYTPKYTEIIAGWNYAFSPAKWALANFKLNYIHRSQNFLAPRADQTGEQGGDSVVAALQVGF